MVVEVDAGKYLFVLLKRDKTWSRALSQGPISLSWYGIDIEEYKAIGNRHAQRQFLWHAARTMRGKRPVNPENLPMLVTFTDINDPASVVRVDPDDLESHFGAGVKLKAVTLEITGEPVTQGEVEKVLGWLWTHAGYLSGNSLLDQERFEQNLTISEFIKGIKP